MTKLEALFAILLLIAFVAVAKYRSLYVDSVKESIRYQNENASFKEAVKYLSSECECPWK